MSLTVPVNPARASVPPVLGLGEFGEPDQIGAPRRNIEEDEALGAAEMQVHMQPVRGSERDFQHDTPSTVSSSRGVPCQYRER